MAKNVCYVVWAGHQTGIFDTWPETQKAVAGFKNARYKGFKSREEAEAAFTGKARPATSPASDSATKPTRQAPGKKPVNKQGGNERRGIKVLSDITLDVQIYCDGAALPNPGESASGIAVYRNGQIHELWYGLYDANGTNNTAELKALHHALLIAEQAQAEGLRVEVLSDSMYALQCLIDWAPGWQKKGWVRQDGEIKNLDLIRPMYELYTRLRGKVRLCHVEAHVGIEGNELADRMSVLGVEEKALALCRYQAPIVISDILKLRAG